MENLYPSEEKRYEDRRLIDSETLRRIDLKLEKVIIIDTKLEQVIIDVKEVKDNFSQRVAYLEAQKMERTEAMRLFLESDKIHEDHEMRLRKVERYGSIAIGILLTIQFVLTYFVLNLKQ